MGTRCRNGDEHRDGEGAQSWGHSTAMGRWQRGEDGAQKWGWGTEMGRGHRDGEVTQG